MNPFCMQCVFELNGEKKVDGFIWFRSDAGVYLTFQTSTGLPRGPVTVKIDPSDCSDIANFFALADVYFWKIVILEPESPYQDVMCIVNFSKDDNGIAIHLSLDFETEKMHIETPVDEDTLEQMPSVWLVALE